MNILSRYISKTIISAILVITLILMGIEMLVTFIGELGNIGVGNYGALQALRFVVLDMPHQLNSLFPMAGLVGSLFGLGLLAGQSELIVMRASGFSTGQISLAVLQAALLILFLAVLLGEIIAPFAENMATSGKVFAKTQGQTIATRQGMWIRQGNDFFHIQAIISNHHLLGILDYELDKNHHLKMATYASRADYQNGRWKLSDIHESIILPEKVIAKTLPSEEWQVQFEPGLVSVANSDPRNMSVKKLYEYIDYLKSNGLRAATYELSFWKRIMQPFATLVMILIAVPFIFGPLRTVTMGLRMVTGIAVGFCFYILNEFFGPLSALYQIPPLIGAVLPTLIFICIGTFLVLRVR